LKDDDDDINPRLRQAAWSPAGTNVVLITAVKFLTSQDISFLKLWRESQTNCKSIHEAAVCSE